MRRSIRENICVVKVMNKSTEQVEEQEIRVIGMFNAEARLEKAVEKTVKESGNTFVRLVSHTETETTYELPDDEFFKLAKPVVKTENKK